MKAYWTGVFGQVAAIAKRVMRDKMALFFYLFVSADFFAGVRHDFQ